MGFLVAIIGRYGVGKTLLSNYFSKAGVSLIPIEPLLLTGVVQLDNHQIWKAYLEQDYQSINAIIPNLLNSELEANLLKYIQSVGQGEHVVVLPSFLNLESILTAFDYVIAVDCAPRVQRGYLENKVGEACVSYWIESGHERTYYTGLATDIFLNSVSLNHLNWVVNQILRTYRLMDLYKG